MAAQHHERHFRGGDAVRDIVLGMSDGLTVPFALAAGLSGAAIASRVIVTAGVAEIVAGCIAMGLGGFLAARTDAEHYRAEHARECAEVRDRPEAEVEEVHEVFSQYGLTREDVAPIVTAFHKHPEAWVDFMMRFELGLDAPDASLAWKSALRIGFAYAVGGAIPLAPYAFVSRSNVALAISAAATLVALGVFGVLKGQVTSVPRGRSAFQVVVVGAIAAAAAFALARIVT